MELVVADILEGHPLHLHGLSVNDDALVQGLGSDAVLHAAHNLKLIFVNRADVRDGRRGPRAVFVLIFFQESSANLCEREQVSVV